MIYLVDPMDILPQACPAKCFTKCDGVCHIKPLYGTPV